MTVRYTFTSSERLRQTRDFLRVKCNGRYFFYKGLAVYLLATGETRPCRLGMVVSKKFGNSVKRNRIKRLIRESFRLHKHTFIPGCDMVVIPTIKIDVITYKNINTIMLHICGKLNIIRMPWKN